MPAGFCLFHDIDKPEFSWGSPGIHLLFTKEDPDLPRPTWRRYLRRFYGRALDDKVLAKPFAELRATGLETHVPTICDFWETVLFRAAHIEAVPCRRIGRSTGVPPVGSSLPRWLTLWHNTVGEMYRGPAADPAKVQAGRIAWAMPRRLTDADAPEFLVMQPARDGRAPDRTGSDDR